MTDRGKTGTLLLMKATVELPDSLFTLLEKQAVSKGMGFNDYITRALEKSVAEETIVKRDLRIVTPPVPTQGLRGEIPAYSNAELEEILIRESIE